MKFSRRHTEHHRTERIGWLRAAVLGANDGIVSTASLLVGVAAASASEANLLVTGVAGLVAGAMSMAAGEYVSVHSQADTEKADLSREHAELQKDPAAEQRELSGIYVDRGLSPDLALQVAEQLMKHDALGAHARDELGISESFKARPVQAAMASAGSFAVGVAAAGDHRTGSAKRFDQLGRGHLDRVSGRARRGGRAGGRSTGVHRRVARDLLGRARDGDHRRGRRAGGAGGLAACRAFRLGSRRDESRF